MVGHEVAGRRCGRTWSGACSPIVPTLLAVSVVIFLLLHSAPGGPMAVYANNPNVDPADLARLEQSLGLHDPYPVQYVKWLGAMLTGNWGDLVQVRAPGRRHPRRAPRSPRSSSCSPRW